MAFPMNEAETIELFRLIEQRIGWRIIQLQTAFPDAIIEDRWGRRLIVEFEFRSKNFRAHKHDPSGCDLIIAYWGNWKNPPVPVWELSRYAKKEAQFLEQMLSAYVPRYKLELANYKIGQLKQRLATKGIELDEYKNAKERFFHLSNLAIIMASAFILIASIPMIVGSFDIVVNYFKMVL